MIAIALAIPTQSPKLVFVPALAASGLESSTATEPRITISNRSEFPVQLLSRHWIITDADNEVQEVRGEGVVGEQPVIRAQSSFSYTSGATLATPVGFMEGEYYMVLRDPFDIKPQDLPTFEVPIAPFTLHTPTALN